MLLGGPMCASINDESTTKDLQTSLRVRSSNEVPSLKPSSSSSSTEKELASFAQSSAGVLASGEGVTTSSSLGPRLVTAQGVRRGGAQFPRLLPVGVKGRAYSTLSSAAGSAPPSRPPSASVSLDNNRDHNHDRSANSSTPSLSSLASASTLPVPLHRVVSIRDDGLLIYYDKPAPIIPCIPARAGFLERHLASCPSARQISTPLGSLLANRTVLVISNPHAQPRISHASHLRNLHELTSILAEAGLKTAYRETDPTTQTDQPIIRLIEREGTTIYRHSAIVVLGDDPVFIDVLDAILKLHTAITADQDTDDQLTSTLHSLSSLHSAYSRSIITIDRRPHLILPPISIVPSGDRNQLATSMCMPTITHAALNIISSLREEKNLPFSFLQYRRVAQNSRERLVTNGIHWGLFAKLDKVTESFKFLGNLRFHLAALTQGLSLDSYLAELRVRIDVPSHRAIIRQLMARRSGSASTVSPTSPSSQNASTDQLLMDNQLDFMFDISKLEASQQQQQQQNRIERVAEDEYLLKGKFAMVIATNTSIIGNNVPVTTVPSYADLRLNDTPTFDVIIIMSRNFSRTDFVRTVSGAKDGTFVNMLENVIYFKATRLEFQKIGGDYLVIDGIAVEPEPFVLEVAPESGTLRRLGTDTMRNVCSWM